MDLVRRSWSALWCLCRALVWGSKGTRGTISGAKGQCDLRSLSPSSPSTLLRVPTAWALSLCCHSIPEPGTVPGPGCSQCLLTTEDCLTKYMKSGRGGQSKWLLRSCIPLSFYSPRNPKRQSYILVIKA